MQPLYIIEPGFIGRSQNSIIFENDVTNRRYPVKDVDSVYFLNEVSINSKSLGLFSRDEIPLHFFGYYGKYLGTFWPKKDKDGKFLIDQYKSFKNRIFFAREFVHGSIHNMRKVLLKSKIRDYPERLEKIMLELPDEIPNILSKEALAKKLYYKCFRFIIKNKDFVFTTRSYHPPKDKINALISFINALLYSTTLTEIYKTKLDPVISYLHEPCNRMSLQYDIADIFKPLIVDRMIFSLVNKRIITCDDFDGIRLKKDSIKKIVSHYDNRLKKTVRFSDYDVFSYKFIIRKECYKIINHIEGKQDYKSFKMWW
jgi:CRISP-associated protein Cas1